MTAEPSAHPTGGTLLGETRGDEPGAPIELEAVSRSFSGPEGPVPAVADMSLTVGTTEIVALVGPSGCGKTTVLNMVAGLVSPTTGSVRRFGKEVTGLDQRVGYMFARPALLPWHTVERNVQMGLAFRRVARGKRNAIAADLIRMTGLEGFGRSYPANLSQGMRQRVALARTLATDPDILLMDEPFAALDAHTKLLMQTEFLRMWTRAPKCVVWVTHDLNEAVALAHRVLVCSRRPCAIKETIAVELEQDRTSPDLRFDPTYIDLCAKVWSALRDEFVADEPNPPDPRGDHG